MAHTLDALATRAQAAGAEVQVEMQGTWRGEISALTADSREVTPGTLFAALPGTQVDGAQFIPMAVERGATAVLMSRDAALPPDLPASIAVLRSPDPRAALAFFSAAFFDRQPQTAVAVTGTNGKTSVASFVRQLWAREGRAAASLGTVGLVTPGGTDTSAHTTPEPVTLHRLLARVASEGVTHIALEASSHGLQQRRLDAVELAAAAFTNISRDHLDYHPTFEDYFSQKLRLFTELLPPSGIAVVDADSPGLDAVRDAMRERGVRTLTVGRAGGDITLAATHIDGLAQRLTFDAFGSRYDVHLPLVGGFQASNAMVAAALAVASGSAAEQVIPAIGALEGPRGRLEPVGRTVSGAGVFVDYAHTPDALRTAGGALRPFTTGRLIIVFGCGGDRDPGKRPQMARAAADVADHVIVTDDNPRSEDPASIRSAALRGASEAREIAGRAEAIAAAVDAAQDGDIILVAGKGHETGQEIAGEMHPFVDHEDRKSVV